MSNLKKQAINIVWFKRDLRFSDHTPLAKAVQSDLPCLLVYNFEPLLIEDPHYSLRHWRFVYQSLVDMNKQLKKYQTQVAIYNQEMISLFKTLNDEFEIKTVYSHQEIGLLNTYNRDKDVRHWLEKRAIT